MWKPEGERARLRASMIVTLAASTFTLADWLVLGAYLALLVVTGWWFCRREKKTTDEYFLAGRRMPVWAVAVSIIATSLSAATFVGAPELSYAGDLTYLSTNIGGLIAVVVVAWFFIPAFYRNNVTTVYELLERRFGPSSKYATSAAFMVGRVFASGARIYIAAIPLAMILFGVDGADRVEALVLGIVALTIVGTVYALFGGIAGVIWTDVIQTGVLVLAVIAAIVVLWLKIDLPMDAVVLELRHESTLDVISRSKLKILETGFSMDGGGLDSSAQFTVLTAIFGFSLINLAAYGTDHDLVQRMLTCKSAIQGGKSVWLSIGIGVPIVAMLLLVGLLLYIWYSPWFEGVQLRRQYMDIEQAIYPTSYPAIQASPVPRKHVFVDFILTEMPPGLRALMLAGLFAAGVGSLTSAINAMAATFIKDFYQRWAPNRGERHYLAASKLAVLGWGGALALFAVVCVYWQRSSPQTTLIGLALGVMTFAYAGLLAVFLTALFTKRGNTRSVIAALITGFVVIGLLQEPVWRLWTPLVPWVGARLSAITLAFPWHMTIGTTLAFIVCVAGRGPAGGSGARSTARTCAQCGYDLSGGRGEVCPECAHPFARS